MNFDVNFDEEELKTVIGSLQVDIRDCWLSSQTHTERLRLLLNLLKKLPYSDEVNKMILENDFNEMPGVFRGGYLFGYESDEGRTQKVYDYLKIILSDQKNNIELSLLSKRNKKINDLGL
jgi:hypothetical protein